MNNMKASEMGKCGENFQISDKKSICYLKLSIMDGVARQQILERTVFLQNVQVSQFLGLQIDDLSFSCQLVFMTVIFSPK